MFNRLIYMGILNRLSEEVLNRSGYKRHSLDDPIELSDGQKNNCLFTMGNYKY